MEAIVAHFRQGRHHQHSRQMILKVGENLEQAKKVVGKTAVWKTSSGKLIKGQIVAVHGRNGNVRANFSEKGLPGQALGTKIKIE